MGKLDSVLGSAVLAARGVGRPGQRRTPEDAGVRRAVLRRDAADGVNRIHAARRPYRRAAGLGTESRDSRQSGRVSLRGDRPLARASVVVHAGRADDQRHPQRRRAPSPRLRPLSRALPGRRADRRYVFNVAESRAGLFGIGGDVTVYHVPQNLLDNYGSPASFHVFLRYRPHRTPMSHTMH